MYLNHIGFMRHNCEYQNASMADAEYIEGGMGGEKRRRAWGMADPYLGLFFRVGDEYKRAREYVREVRHVLSCAYDSGLLLIWILHHGESGMRAVRYATVDCFICLHTMRCDYRDPPIAYPP